MTIKKITLVALTFSCGFIAGMNDQSTQEREENKKQYAQYIMILNDEQLIEELYYNMSNIANKEILLKSSIKKYSDCIQARIYELSSPLERCIICNKIQKEYELHSMQYNENMNKANIIINEVYKRGISLQ